MKRLSLLLMLFLAALSKLPAQISDDSYVPDDMSAVYFSVKNSDNKPVKDAEVRAVDQQSRGELWAMTDNRGNAYLRLYKGHKYTIKVPGNDSASVLSIPQNSTGIITLALKCDPPAVTNLAVSTDTIFQKTGDKDRPGKYESMVKLRVLNTSLEPLPDVRVTVHGSGTSTYAGITKSDGYVRFILPQGQKMFIDIGKARNISQCSVPNSQDAVLSKEIRYEPTNIKETVKGDTIRQDLKMTQRATSERASMHIQVNDLQHKPLADEMIFLDTDSSKTVYAAVTDKYGRAVLLVPKGNDYMLHFKYERNIDHIRLATAQGLHNISIEFGYIGSKKIEEYYANAQRDQAGFLTDFMEGHVEYEAPSSSSTSVYDLQDYTFTKTDNGYTITFKGEDPAYAPAISGDKVFTCGGYFNNKLYCIDNNSGAKKWGIRLAEGGASPATVSGNYLLVNTESCSLYIIDIVTGKCLWSKWLSEYLWTGPTVYNDKVYAVYKNNLGDSKYVMACFELKTGKVVWQKWLSSEGVAAPVAHNNQIFLTTNKGALLCFDAATGKESVVAAIGITSPPTITDEFIYASRRTITDSSAKVVLFDRKTFAEKSSWAQYKLPDLLKKNSRDLMSSMAFCGSRVTIAGANAYFTSGEKLICADAKTGKQKWSADASTSGIMMPVVAGKKIIAGNKEGKLLVLDSESGKETKRFDAGSVTSSPAADKGKIYTGTAKGEIKCFDTGDATITGGGVWCYNPEHNPVIK